MVKNNKFCAFVLLDCVKILPASEFMLPDCVTNLPDREFML